MEKHQFYKIEWTDHFSDSSWKDKVEIASWVKEDIKHNCTTVGIITYEDDKIVVVSASFVKGLNKDDSFGENMAIYKNNIIKRTKIKV